MAYADLAAVIAITPQRAAYDTTTIPTAAQVGTFLTDIAGEIDARLEAAGIAVPVTSPASFVAWLGRLNAYGAASLAEEAANPEAEGGGVAERWWTRYTDGLKAISDGSALPASLAQSGSSRVMPRSYGTDNPGSDGEPPAPVFAMSDRF